MKNSRPKILQTQLKIQKAGRIITTKSRLRLSKARLTSWLKTSSRSWIFIRKFKVLGLTQAKSSTPHRMQNNIAKLVDYLQSYFDLLKDTEKCINETRVHKQAELSSIDKIFNQIRLEIDSKERLIKSQFNLMVRYFEEPLQRDLGYLSDKCYSLCDSLNTIMSAYSSTHSITKL